jgi:hypothetical protein
MRRLLRLWFSLGEPVGPAAYLVSGIGLMALKYGVDASVVWLATHHFWSPLAYLHPVFTARQEGLDLPTALQLALALWTMPFLWIGVTMSVRRAVDAGHSAWLGLWFLVPLVNYVLMVYLSLTPRRAPDAWADEVPPPELDERLRSALWGIAASVLVGLTMALACTRVLQDYVAGLFLGTPFAMGVACGFVHNRRHARDVRETLFVAVVGQAVAAGMLLLFAIEGLICVIMAIPLAVPLAVMGAFLGRAIALHAPRRMSTAGFVVLALPATALFESRFPEPSPDYEARSAIVVDAPPEVVWSRVVSFDPLPPPTEALFRLGVACPERARIVGRGVGAMRHCEFSTGSFVEPITRWDEPRVLGFDVISQPEPLREWSPYRSLWTPHLVGSFRAVRGEFRLVSLPGGRTRLEGSTWYTLDVHPRTYWRAWSDGFVETIHRRVLQGIARQAEADHSG